ncbi:MAG: hypothetical protein ABIC04_07860 [Nanoarchaeota archaeon]
MANNKRVKLTLDCGSEGIKEIVVPDVPMGLYLLDSETAVERKPEEDYRFPERRTEIEIAYSIIFQHIGDVVDDYEPAFRTFIGGNKDRQEVYTLRVGLIRTILDLGFTPEGQRGLEKKIMLEDGHDFSSTEYNRMVTFIRSKLLHGIFKTKEIRKRKQNTIVDIVGEHVLKNHRQHSDIDLETKETLGKLEDSTILAWLGNRTIFPIQSEAVLCEIVKSVDKLGGKNYLVEAGFIEREAGEYGKIDMKPYGLTNRLKHLDLGGYPIQEKATYRFNPITLADYTGKVVNVQKLFGRWKRRIQEKGLKGHYAEVDEWGRDAAWRVKIGRRATGEVNISFKVLDAAFYLGGEIKDSDLKPALRKIMKVEEYEPKASKKYKKPPKEMVTAEIIDLKNTLNINLPEICRQYVILDEMLREMIDGKVQHIYDNNEFSRDYDPLQLQVLSEHVREVISFERFSNVSPLFQNAVKPFKNLFNPFVAPEDMELLRRYVQDTKLDEIPLAYALHPSPSYACAKIIGKGETRLERWIWAVAGFQSSVLNPSRAMFTELPTLYTETGEIEAGTFNSLVYAVRQREDNISQKLFEAVHFLKLYGELRKEMSEKVNVFGLDVKAKKAYTLSASRVISRAYTQCGLPVKKEPLNIDKIRPETVKTVLDQCGFSNLTAVYDNLMLIKELQSYNLRRFS